MSKHIDRRTTDTDEPYGHRGHPSEYEVLKARVVAGRLVHTVRQMRRQGYGTAEALDVVAEVAHRTALSNGEAWSNWRSARLTVEALYLGGAAKEWSIGAVRQALRTLGRRKAFG